MKKTKSTIMMANNSELQYLREKVRYELNWLQKKTDTLTVNECRILLSNKKTYIRNLYCNSCGEQPSIPIIKLVEGEPKRICEICNTRGYEINPVYDNIELDNLNKIIICDKVINKDERKCKRIKKRLQKELIEFLTNNINKSPALTDDELIKRFISEYKFKSYDSVFHFSISEEEHKIILSTIKTFLIKKERIFTEEDITKLVLFEGSNIRIKGILLDNYEIEDLVLLLVHNISVEKLRIKTEARQKIIQLFDEFTETIVIPEYSDDIIAKFCDQYLLDGEISDI